VLGTELTSDALGLPLLKLRKAALPRSGIACLLTSSQIQACGWFALLWAFAVAVQLWLGAYQVDLGNHPDESVHFLNALVLRDYLTNSFGTNPVSFASNYYLHYPKIAPLVWPPLRIFPQKAPTNASSSGSITSRFAR